MARKSKNRTLKKAIYLFWEGESEKAYSQFMKNEFENCSVIKIHREKGTFETAKSCFKNDKRFKNYVNEYDEMWFFFDTEIETGDKWDENMKAISGIVKSRSKKKPIKIRLLMTSGCIEYWLLLHYQQTAPQIITTADKNRVMAELLKEKSTYKKGDYESTKSIAVDYPLAIENGKWSLERLKREGMPQDDEEKRNRWLYKGTHTFTTVHEALEFLLSLKR